MGLLGERGALFAVAWPVAGSLCLETPFMAPGVIILFGLWKKSSTFLLQRPECPERPPARRRAPPYQTLPFLPSPRTEGCAPAGGVDSGP